MITLLKIKAIMKAKNPKYKDLIKSLRKKYKFIIVLYLVLLLVIFLFEYFFILKKFEISCFLIFENLLGVISYNENLMPKWIFTVNSILGQINNAIFLGIIVAVIIEYGDIQKVNKKVEIKD